jgi:hypothetical protein
MYLNQGQYTFAEPLFNRSLSIVEKTLGPNHPYSAAVLNNMAKLYRATNRSKEAEAFEQRVKKIHAVK